ncbi:MAG TPA: Hpt domain-containing protein [Rhodocyclaceae bacterium]|nr:Hpt domain-containing protein [Rhodocyclaceae bacterium]
MADKFELDKTLILERLGGDLDLFGVMADMYLQDWGNYSRQIGEALAAANGPVLARHAHTIKSLLATFADQTGAALAARTEMRAKEGRIEELSGPVAEIQERLRLVAVALEKELA